MKVGLLSLGLLLITVASPVLCFAEDIPVSPKLMPDLDQIVEDQKVSPVAGITAAGQPDRAAMEVFADSGYTTVIDLRGPQESRGFDEAAVVAELGMDYIAFPITTGEQISFEYAAKLDEVISQAEGPVLVHCASSNRVGALLALRASLAGASDEQALAHGIDGGLTSLAGPVQEILSSQL